MESRLTKLLVNPQYLSVPIHQSLHKFIKLISTFSKSIRCNLNQLFEAFGTHTFNVKQTQLLVNSRTQRIRDSFKIVLLRILLRWNSPVRDWQRFELTTNYFWLRRRVNYKVSYNKLPVINGWLHSERS